MRKTNVSHVIGAVLGSMLLVTSSVSLVGAYRNELRAQEVGLEQIQNQLQMILDLIITDIQKQEHSSLSLRDFSHNTLFSCRGLA
ncbi:MAG: hypothetical protein JXA75_04605 [Candidatus Thermoplasmatota archaeon]|nr:hypothetical protein [Candidatus Thermoplasmatota archaeon]